MLPLAGHADDDGAKRPGSAALSETALTGKQVVVIGGGPLHEAVQRRAQALVGKLEVLIRIPACPG